MTRATSSDGWLIGALAAVCVMGACRGEETPAAVSPPEANVYSIAVVAATANDLPGCTSDLAGTTAYVQSPVGLFTCTGGAWAPVQCNKGQTGSVAYASANQTLLACVSGAWTPIPLPPGPQGPTGLQGAEGAVGPAGPMGASGSTSLVVSSIEAPGANCTDGGVKLTFGLDQNDDATLENGEVTSVSYVCNGAGVMTGPTAGGAGLATTAGGCVSDGDCDQNYFCNGGTCDLKAVQIAVGANRLGFALLFNGTVQSFVASGAARPSGIRGVGGVAQIAAGGTNVCAVMADETVLCGDRNFGGRAPVTGLTSVKAVAAGSAHVCALKSDGAVWCWGRNDEGQLGPGATGPSSKAPVMVLAGDAVAIASGPGSAHTCAILSGGALACWGANGNGQLGSGAASTHAQIPVPGVSDVTSLSVGSNGTCVLKSGTFPQCWGPSRTPAFGGLIVALTKGGSGESAPKIAGDDFFCALAVDGSVSCMGFNGQGQLGNGTTARTSDVVAVSNLTGAQSIASGTIDSCAILSNGSVSCWGQPLLAVAGWAMGTSCSSDSDCASGPCLGGLCCTAACASTDQSCAATACDSSGACVYPDPTAACGAPSCTGSTLTTGTCDGGGNCVFGSAPCDGQLACDPSDNMSCLASCAADTDCAAGSICDLTSGTCNPM